MTDDITETPIVKPRVMYLDIDDTLLVWTPSYGGFAAPKATEFLNWAMEHFEVRWLTFWAQSGSMNKDLAEELSYRFNHKVPPETFTSIENSKSFLVNKTDAIDFSDPRPWVWVEDSLFSFDEKVLRDTKKLDRFYPTNVSHNVVALQSTWRKLCKEFNLPGIPTTPYTTKPEIPVTPLTMEDIMNRFRSNAGPKTIYDH